MKCLVGGRVWALAAWVMLALYDWKYVAHDGWDGVSAGCLE